MTADASLALQEQDVPLYNTEIAPAKHRGFVVGLTQQMIGIGFIVANWVGYGCQFLDGNKQWRLPLGLQFMPRSPRWLLEKGREDMAHAVVRKLHGSSPEEQAAADTEFEEMRETIAAEKVVRSRSLSDLWATRGMLRRTLVAVGVQVFGQFSGINVINYFGPSMYKALGLSAGQSLLVQGIYGAVGPITNFFFITLILDTVGRKKPLMFGAGSFVVTYSVLTAIVACFPPDQSTNLAAQRAGIAMIFMTSIFFSLSFGPVSWVLASEVFPTRTRSIGTSVATCANWAFNVLFSQVSNLAINNISWRYYLVFICLNAIDFVIIALFFPETKGKSLEQMAEVFGDEIDAHDVLGAAAKEKMEHHELDVEKSPSLVAGVLFVDIIIVTVVASAHRVIGEEIDFHLVRETVGLLVVFHIFVIVFVVFVFVFLFFILPIRHLFVLFFVRDSGWSLDIDLGRGMYALRYSLRKPIPSKRRHSVATNKDERFGSHAIETTALFPVDSSYTMFLPRMSQTLICSMRSPPVKRAKEPNQEWRNHENGTVAPRGRKETRVAWARSDLLNVLPMPQVSRDTAPAMLEVDRDARIHPGGPRSRWGVEMKRFGRVCGLVCEGDDRVRFAPAGHLDLRVVGLAPAVVRVECALTNQLPRVVLVPFEFVDRPDCSLTLSRTRNPPVRQDDNWATEIAKRPSRHFTLAIGSPGEALDTVVIRDENKLALLVGRDVSRYV
ncbi:hypothetical protein ACG7TL_006811 [Trametes sanguinea]